MKVVIFSWSIVFLTLRTLLQFRINCSMFSSSFAHNKLFESFSFFYILIRLPGRMYVPVSSFNFNGSLAASTAEWQLILNKGWIIPVFRFSTVRKSSPLYNGCSCIIGALQWLYTVFLTIVHMVFLTGLSRYQLASFQNKNSIIRWLACNM